MGWVLVRKISLDLGGTMVDGFLFYDLGREKEEKTLFYQRLHDVMKRLRSRALRPLENHRMVFGDVAGGRDISADLLVKLFKL